MIRDRTDLLKVKGGKAYCKRNIDTFRSFARGLLVDLILLYCHMIRLVFLKLIKEKIQGRHMSRILFTNICVRKHGHYHAKVLLVFGCFIQQIEHKCFQKCGLGFLPKGV